MRRCLTCATELPGRRYRRYCDYRCYRVARTRREAGPIPALTATSSQRLAVIDAVMDACPDYPLILMILGLAEDSTEVPT